VLEFPEKYWKHLLEE